MMSCSDLDELHQSILILCGEGMEVLKPKNAAKKECQDTTINFCCTEQEEYGKSEQISNNKSKISNTIEDQLEEIQQCEDKLQNGTILDNTVLNLNNLPTVSLPSNSPRCCAFSETSECIEEILLVKTRTEDNKNIKNTTSKSTTDISQERNDICKTGHTDCNSCLKTRHRPNNTEENVSIIESFRLSQNAPSTSQALSKNISKIVNGNIFQNKKSQQKHCQQEICGRFTNFAGSFLSNIEVTEDENEQSDYEDILGLNDYTYNKADDIDLDDDDEAMLLDESVTDLPQSLKNKYMKLNEKISVEIQRTGVNEIISGNKNDVFEENEELVKLPPGPSEGKNDLKENSSLQKITGNIDYIAEKQYFNITSPGVREVIHLWGSKGIHDPDTNLSFATNLRAKSPHEKGMLEGTHITCICLQQSVRAENECAFLMRKRQKLDNGANTTSEILNLQRQLKEIQCEHDSNLADVEQRWQYEQNCLAERHRPVIRNLKLYQEMEIKENNKRLRIHGNVHLFQMHATRLRFEHAQQEAQCRSKFNAEMRHLEHHFQRRELDIERNFNHRKAQLESLIEQIKQVKSDGKYVHPVRVNFVKGPCRSNNQTRSFVEVYVPAQVAGCILKEDEVIDSFYEYSS